MEKTSKHPKEIFRKIIRDKRFINEHIAKGGRLEELHGIRFSKPQPLQNS